MSEQVLTSDKEPGDSSTHSGLALKITGMRHIADQVLEVTFSAADNTDLPPWEPGAHVSFALPNGLERQYSLCGSLGDRNTWRIGVLRATEGRGGSDIIHRSWRVGDRVMASLPRNLFPLAPASSYLFIAGGIGITPLLPMIEHVRHDCRPWRLVYGGRSRDSMAFLDEIARLEGDVTLVPENEAGRLDLQSLIGDLSEGGLVYGCGPEGLLNALHAQSRSWPKNTLRIERFSPAAQAESRINRAFTAKLRASGGSIRVEADESLLDALARGGVARPSACREGTCGTCETRVISGAIDHRDSVLSDDERESGQWMMACVSRAKGDEIELDL